MDKEWLNKRIAFDSEVLNNHLKKCMKGEYKIGSYLSSTGTTLLSMGFLEFLYDSDILNFENRLSMGAKYQLSSIRSDGFITSDTIFTSLLSNDSDVIQAVSDPNLLPTRVDYDPMEDRPIEDYPIHPGLDLIHQTIKGFQSILANDQENLAAAILQNEEYKSSKKVKWSKIDDLFQSYNKSILEKDQDTLQKTIDQMYKKQKSIGGFVSYPVYSNMHGFIKLAIHAGMEVQLNKPDIIWDVINAKPLKKYDSFDWLDVLFYEGWDAYYEKFGKLHNQKRRNY